MTQLYKITSVKDPKKVFDLARFETKNGARIKSYKDMKSQSNQKFYFQGGYLLPWLDDKKCVCVNPKDSSLFLWEKDRDKESHQKWIFHNKTFRSPSNGKYITFHGKSSKLSMEELNENDIESQQFNLVPTSTDLKSSLQSFGLGIGKFFKGSGDKKGGGGGFSSAPDEEEERRREEERKKRRIYPEKEEKEIEKFQYWCTCSKMIVGVRNSRIGLYSSTEPTSVDHMWSFRKDGFIVYSGGGFLDIVFGRLGINPDDPNISKTGNIWEREGKRIVHKRSEKVLAVASEGNELILEDKNGQRDMFQTFEWTDNPQITTEEKKEVFDVYFQPPVYDGPKVLIEPEKNEKKLDGAPDVNKLLESGTDDSFATEYTI